MLSHMLSLLPLLILSLSSTVASPVPLPLASPDHPEFPPILAERQSGCTSYTIINTRGTGEPQRESSGFTSINRAVLSAISGGSVYNTVYSASFSQVSTAGTRDILARLSSELRANPSKCFILEGYSQGAAATVNALKELGTGDARFAAVKGVFLIGNPTHTAGLACNVDTNGGTTTKNVNGLSYRLGGVPSEWVSKTLDVCNFVSHDSSCFPRDCDERAV